MVSMRIKQIVDRLIGDAEEFSLEHRILNRVILMGILIFIYSSAVSFLFNIGDYNGIIDLTAIVFLLCLYYLSFYKRMYHVSLYLGLFVLGFVYIPVLWINCAGLDGTMPQYVILLSVMASLLIFRKRLVAFILSLIAVIESLIILEYYFPSLTVAYKSRYIRFVDIACTMFICIISISMLVGSVLHSYQKERDFVKQCLEKIEKQKREIEYQRNLLKSKNDELKTLKEKAEQLNKVLQEEKKTLEQISITDYLTEINNRRFININLETEIKKALRYGNNLSIIMMDIDNFKSINDMYGHHVGDQVLKTISKTIKSNLREVDLVGRYGGEEFLIILPNTGLEAAYNIADRIRNKIAKIKFDNYDIKVTISGGVAQLKDDKGTDLLKKADALLYKAKEKGRNRIEAKL